MLIHFDKMHERDRHTDTHARTHTQTPHDGEGRACRASRGNKVWHCLPKSPFSTSLCTVVWLLVVWSLRPSIKSAVVSLVVLSYVTSLTQLNALQGLLSIHAFSCPVISCPALLRPDILSCDLVCQFHFMSCISMHCIFSAPVSRDVLLHTIRLNNMTYHYQVRFTLLNSTVSALTLYSPH